MSIGEKAALLRILREKGKFRKGKKVKIGKRK